MKGLGVVWLCLLVLPVSAFAQGVVSGVVADADGDVLPGVTVELRGQNGPGPPVRTGITNGRGVYTFGDLPPGTYSVRFSLPGYVTTSREGVVVTAGSAPLTVDAVLALPFSSGPAPPQNVPDRRCLHDELETGTERQRRDDALAAMRLIDTVLATFPLSRTMSPGWDEVSASDAVGRLRGRGDDLALRMRWGTAEPLPGWGIAWATTRTRSRYALVDLRDPCGFAYSSEDPDVLPPGRVRVAPLSSAQLPGPSTTRVPME